MDTGQEPASRELPDGDGDGSPRGIDCDDSDPDIYPGSWHEKPYDGVDSDCDGANDWDADHDGDDDRDEDGDGALNYTWGGLDCDDHDPSVHPGAEDPPCDGVDQDCSGNNDADSDADGSQDGACGGDDCSDSDPWVGSGLPEYCTDLDNDCDGAVRSAGSCAHEQDVHATATAVLQHHRVDGVAVTSIAANVGDIDADGADELLLTCSGCVDGQAVGAVTLAELPANRSLDLEVADQIEWWLTLPRDGSVRPIGFPGVDFNGDSIIDLVVVGRTYADSTYLWAVSSPLEPTGQVSDTADATMINAVKDTVFTDVGTGVGDINSDGFDDVIVGVSTDAGDGAALILGRPDEVTANARDEILLYAGEGEGVSYLAAGDVFGEGVETILLAETDGTLSLVSGLDAVALDGAAVAPLAAHVWAANRVTCITTIGDWNMDGYDDYVVGDMYDSDSASSAGAVYIMAGGSDSSLQHLTDGAHAKLSGATPSAAVGATCTSTSLDGDGAPDLLLQAYSEAGEWKTHVIAAHTGLPAGHSVIEPHLSFGTSAGLAQASTLRAHGDFNGDDAGDLVFDATDGAGNTGMAVVNGWAVPWSEEAWW